MPFWYKKDILVRFYCFSVLNIKNMSYFKGKYQHFQVEILLWYKKDIILYSSICTSYQENNCLQCSKGGNLHGHIPGVSTALGPRAAPPVLCAGQLVSHYDPGYYHRRQRPGCLSDSQIDCTCILWYPGVSALLIISFFVTRSYRWNQWPVSAWTFYHPVKHMSINWEGQYFG